MARLGGRIGRIPGLLVGDPAPLWGTRRLQASYAHFVGYVALIIAAATRSPVVGGAALLFAAVVEASAILLPRHRERSRVRWREQFDVRAHWRSLLFVLALAMGGVPWEAIAAFATFSFSTSVVSRAMRSSVLNLQTTRLLQPVGGLEVGAARMVRARRLARRRDLADLPLHGSVLVAGFLLTLPGVVDGLSVAAATIVGGALVAAAVGYVGLVALACRSLRPSLLLHHDDEVLAAYQEFDPEIICYFNGHPGSTYAIDVWLRTLELCGRRVAIVYRHQSVTSVDTTMLPAIVVQKEATVEKMVTPSTRIALYPANTTLNVHLQRDKRLSHVFIGHGDSDKAGSASPYTRSYDQVWVSGRAAVDRYGAAGVVIPEERFVFVGRPPLSPRVRAAETEHLAQRFLEAGWPDPIAALLAELDGADGDRRPRTVLYAPTWEGYFDDSDYSSLEAMGSEIVEVLLRTFPEFRVVFKPHPMTGGRKGHLKGIVREIRGALEAAPVHNPSTDAHPGVDLHAWFDLADLLIADVSSVISDFLAWDRPLVVTNPLRLAVEDLKRRFPTTAAGHVIDPGSPATTAVLAAAIEHDPLRSRRHESRIHFLGDIDADPLDLFIDAVDSLYNSTPTRSP